jgi:Fur family peroxide stress response transcriptional regulator
MQDHDDPQAMLGEKLEQSGLRATRQRELIYGILTSQPDHPTADEVFVRAKKDMPSISLATVYNCLETLAHCNLVKQVNFERQPTRYCPNLHEHAHFHDESTGRVFDIDLDPRTVAKLHAVLPEGYDATSVHITFRGKAPHPARVRSSAPSSR